MLEKQSSTNDAPTQERACPVENQGNGTIERPVLNTKRTIKKVSNKPIYNAASGRPMCSYCRMKIGSWTGPDNLPYCHGHCPI